MARIYDSQIEWQAPTAHRFQAQPLKDYISNGLANVAQASAQASEGIQKIRDQDAASKMKLAASAAQDYIDNFEDYSAENYMGVMEANAMKFWDDAFASLDEPTKRRFEQNNPEARDIFNLKVHESATDKTFKHIYSEYDRRVPMMANEITALDDPNEIKSILEATVDSILNTSGMRAEDAEKIIDKLREEVSKGAINQMIGEGRFEEAAALTNDLQFSALISPSDRAKFNTTIQKALDDAKKESEKKEPSESEKQKEIRDTVFNGTRSALSDAYDVAKARGESSKWADMYYKFLNDFQEGKLSDVYNIYDDDGNVVDSFTAAQLLGDDSFALLTDMEYADRIAVAENLLKAFESSPAVMRRIGEITTNGGSLLDSLPRDDNGRVAVASLTDTQVGRIKEILDATDEDFAVINKPVRDLYFELRRIYAARQNLQRATIRPTNYISPDDVVELGGFFTNTENVASVSGQYTYGEMSRARSGPAVKQAGGTINDSSARKSMFERLEPYWAYNNNGKRPTAGSNHMMVDMNMAALLDADDETKKALGIYGYTDEEVVGARNSVANNYTKFGIFDEAVDGKNALHVRPTMPYDSPTKWDEMSVNERKAAYQMYTKGKFGNWVSYRKYPDFVTKGTSGFSGRENIADFEKKIVADIEKGLTEDKNLYGNLTSAVDVVKAAATAGDRDAVFGFDASKPIEETDYYASLVGMVKKVNPSANPDATVVRNLASRVRSANYQTWLNKVGGALGWSAGASKYAKGSQTQETAESLSSLTVGTQGL